MADLIRKALEQLLFVVKPKYTDPDEIVALAGAVVAARAALAALAAQPAAAAVDTPLDLDALLSPEGAYERGTFNDDGAQLLSARGRGPDYWRPVYGCDTLDTLLTQIRARILPRLRPPIAGIDVPGGDGDYGGLQELCEAEGVDVRIGAPLLKRARQAWREAAQPPAPPPAPASDGEREELVRWLYRLADERSCNRRRGIRPHPSALTRAATLLRQPAPAAVPVAVAERPWERERWCDDEGQCWMGDPGGSGFIPSWRLCRPEDAPNMTASLPHWAISIPQPPQGGKVQS
jgi:hypothetical protein